MYHTHTCMYVCTYMDLCVRAFIYIHTCMHTFTQTYTCIQYLYVHIHTWIHTYILSYIEIDYLCFLLTGKKDLGHFWRRGARVKKMDRRVFTFQNISSTDASDEDSDSGCSVRISGIQLYSPHDHAERDESARYISRSSSLKTVKVPATRKNNSSRASFNCCRDNQELTISNKTELIKTHSLPGINFPRTNTSCDSPQMRPLSPTSKVNSWRSGLPLHIRTSDQNSEQPSTRSRRISMKNISTENSEDKTRLSLECLYPVLPLSLHHIVQNHMWLCPNPPLRLFLRVLPRLIALESLRGFVQMRCHLYHLARAPCHAQPRQDVAPHCPLLKEYPDWGEPRHCHPLMQCPHTAKHEKLTIENTTQY